MKILVLLIEDQDCLVWDIFYDLLNKDDPDLLYKLSFLAKKHMPYIFKDKSSEVFMKENTNKEDNPYIKSWVYKPYYVNGVMYRHYIFGIEEKEIK